MKSTGVVRNVDELGRIVVPIEIRRELGLDQEQYVKVVYEKTGVRICRLCDGGEGLTRKNDSLGRVVIPKEIRRVLGIKEKDPVEIFLDNGTIFIKKYVSAGACAVTGEVLDDNQSFLNGRLILTKELAQQLGDELGTRLLRGTNLGVAQ